MKIVWERDDIRAGRRVGKPERWERWIIGYEDAHRDREVRWCLISTTDGMVQSGFTREALAALLTSSGEFPEEALILPEERLAPPPVLAGRYKPEAEREAIAKRGPPA